MSSESLTLQQLKDMKQLARLMGATDSISSDVAGATSGLSVHAATASDAKAGSTLEGTLTGKLDATAVASGQMLECNISGNAATASAAEAGSALETTLNEKLDTAVVVTHTVEVGYSVAGDWAHTSYDQWNIDTIKVKSQQIGQYKLHVGDIIVNTTGFQDGTKVSSIDGSNFLYHTIQFDKNRLAGPPSADITVIGIRGKAVFNSANDNKMGALALTSSTTSYGNDGEYFSSLYQHDAAYLVYGGYSASQSATWTTWNGGMYGLLVNQNVAARGYYARSDRRIKTDIEDVPDALALDQVRRIPCRYYKYTDKLLNGPNQVIGFIAQEVNEVLPSAVSKTTEEIPDHMKLAELTWEDVDGKHFITVSNLNEDVANGTKVKFICSTGTPPEFNEDGSVKTPASDDFKGEEECVVMENGKFLMKKKYDSVFIYGKEVNDFLHIDKQRIFALHHSAIQELDRTVEAQKATIATQQAAIDALMARVAALEGQ